MDDSSMKATRLDAPVRSVGRVRVDRRSRARWALGFAATCVVGCAVSAPTTSPAAPVCVTPDGPLEILTATAGDGGVRSVTEGSTVWIQYGSQGGQHLPIGFRGAGFATTGTTRVELRAERGADGVEIGVVRFNSRLPRDAADPTAVSLAPYTLFLRDERYCDVIGGDVVLRVTASDATRCLASVVRVRVAGFDPNQDPRSTASFVNCCVERQPRCYPPDAARP
jgi:hypothetical protein